MEGRYNIRSPAVKRLMKEAQELSEPTDQYFAQPLEDNLFEWHFTVRGPADSDFQNGIYHGRIILPVDYPMKPPSIIWLTPNGRFETNKKICLSISGHHPESWQPSWSIRTALLAIIGFMPTHPGGAIGSLDYKPEERKSLAKKSRSWKCPVCDDISGILLDVTPESQSANKEAQELAAQISFQGEKPKSKADEGPSKEESKKEDGPSPQNEVKATAPTSPEIGLEKVSSTDIVKTGTSVDIQTSSSAPGTTSAANIAGASSQPPPPVLTPASAVFSAPPSSTSGVPPWCAVPPFPPQSFYSGHNPFYGAPPALPHRFPYPPSFYSTSSSFYPPGCALPPGVGMFPCPFPPPIPAHALTSRAPAVISANNSSAHGTVPRPRAQTSSVSYSRTPMTCPSISVGSQIQRGPALGEKVVANSGPVEQTIDPAERKERSQVLDELLTKVKRVESEENSLKAQVRKESKEIQESEKVKDNEPCHVALTENQAQSDMSVESKENSLEAQVSKESEEMQEKENIKDNVPCHVELKENQARSDMSTCLKKDNAAGDASTSEVVSSDAENSEADVPPLEASEPDQRFGLEKSTCNSTTELEKWKLKRLQSKGLRQRQSATASINPEVREEINPSPVPSGQRIEAESGDSGPRSRLQPGDQAPVAAQANHNMLRRTPGTGLRYNSAFDCSFFVMVVLFICTVGLLLNRLLMHWAKDLTSKPT